MARRLCEAVPSSEDCMLLTCGWACAGTYNMLCLRDLQILVNWTNDFNKADIVRGFFQRMMKFTCRHKCLSLNNPVGEGPVEGHVYTGPVIWCHCRGLQGAVTISRVMVPLPWAVLALESLGYWLKSWDSMFPSPSSILLSLRWRLPTLHVVCAACAPNCSPALWEMSYSLKLTQLKVIKANPGLLLTFGLA